MHIELHCKGCHTWFTSSSLNADNSAILDKIEGEGPWGALGDGETLEDRLFLELESADAIRCPHCGNAVPLSEENLASMSLQLLEQW